MVYIARFLGFSAAIFKGAFLRAMQIFVLYLATCSSPVYLPCTVCEDLHILISYSNVYQGPVVCVCLVCFFGAGALP